MTVWRRRAARLVLTAAVTVVLGCESSRAEPEATAPSTTTSASTTTVPERIVFVYQQDVPIDALAGAALAKRGVLLPVPRCGEVPQTTLDALRKLRATDVQRVGGPEAVCDDVMRQLEDALPH